MKKLLPIGSIVLLKNTTKRVLICGRLPLQKSDNKVFDYLACYYPEGIMSPEEVFLFNDEDIAKLYFIGFQDEDEEVLSKKIEEYFENSNMDKLDEDI